MAEVCALRVLLVFCCFSCCGRCNSSVQFLVSVMLIIVLVLKPRDHISSALRELHWPPIGERVVFKLCFLVHKASLGQSPDDITDLLQPVAATSSRSSLRDANASHGDYVVPRTNRKTAEHFPLLHRERGTSCRLN